MSPRARITLAILFLIALGLDFLFYTGFFASDDLQYLTGARKIAGILELRGPGSAAPGMGNARLGITVPAGIIYWVTGGSVAAVAWFHVGYHLALVGLAFAVGRAFAGERIGLGAAAIAATSPVFYVFAGAILPDNLTACLLAIILLLLERVRRLEAEGGPLGRRAALRWYLSIGFLFGLGYACKDTVLIMTVPAAACVMASAPSLKSPVWIRNGAFMVAGLALFLLLEALALRAIMGEWVFRPAMVEEVGDVFLQRMQTQGGANPLSRLWFAVGDRLASLAPLTIWILLAGAIGHAFTRERRLPLLLFFWWPFFYMTIGTTSFTAYRPSSIQPRYYAILIVPAAVMTALAARALWRRWAGWARPPALLRGRLALAAIGALAAALLVVELVGNLPRSGNLYKSPFVRALAAAHQRAHDDYPQYPIVIGSSIGGRMKPLLGRRKDERLFWAGDPTQPEPPYLLVGLAGDADEPRDPALAVEPLALVRPARSRFDQVASEVEVLFGLPPHAGPTPHPGIAGTVELVTRAGAKPPAGRAIAGPWMPSGGSPRLTAVEGGTMVVWDARIEFNLQELERGGQQSAPRDPRARLDAPAGRVRIAVPVRLLTGKAARVALIGFGYGADGPMISRQSSDAAVLVGAAPSTLAIELGSPAGISSIRIRLRVRATRGGALFVAHPVVDEAPL
jgi:hypothetical protein